MPDLKISSVGSDVISLVSPLEVAELDGEGARAILIPDDSIFSSTFFGVNRAFCEMFGYEGRDFQSKTFTMLTGVATDTKLLQGMWAETVRGSDECFTFKMYEKSGEMKFVQMSLLPRAISGSGRNHPFSFAVVARLQECPTSDSRTIDDERSCSNLAVKSCSQNTVIDDTGVIDENNFSEVIQRGQNMATKESFNQASVLKKENELISKQPNEHPGSSTLPKTKVRLRPLRRHSAARHDEHINPTDVRAPKLRRPSSALREAFPRVIAEAIMEGRRPEPITRDQVSVFFSDIVGFTSLSSALDPARVSSLLTRLFAKFDALARLHGIQKLDVIGDAYLAATNMLEDQAADHAARLARFAMDAVVAAAATRLDDDDPASQAIQIRVGLHSGPVSATVVGAQGFKYTLFGDTVNTASRMESTSLPGRIQCSAAAAALIADQDPQVPLAAREGGADVKGKGRMPTCWVGRTAAPEPSAETKSRTPRRSVAGIGPASGSGRSRASGGLMALLRGSRVAALQL